jgi:hypothetical protein
MHRLRRSQWIQEWLFDREMQEGNEQGEVMQSRSPDNDSDHTATTPETRGRSIRRIAISAAALTAGILAFGANEAIAAPASVPSATTGASPTTDAPTMPGVRVTYQPYDQSSLPGVKPCAFAGDFLCTLVVPGPDLDKYKGW